MATTRRTYCSAKCPHFMQGHRECLSCELIDDTAMRRHRQLDDTIPAPACDANPADTAPSLLAAARAFCDNLLRLPPTRQRVCLALAATPRRRNLHTTLGLPRSTFAAEKRSLLADPYWRKALASAGTRVPARPGAKALASAGTRVPARPGAKVLSDRHPLGPLGEATP